MKHQFIGLFVFFPMFLLAQAAEWGVGVLMLPLESKGLITTYDLPSGNENGTLGMEEDTNNRLNLSWREEEGVQMAIPSEGIISIGYEISGLIIHKEQDGFLKIMYRSGDISAWIPINKLQESGFVHQPWIQFMSNKHRTFFTMEYGMNLRDQPNIKGNKILTVKGNQFEITPTGKVKGFWAEVVISEYDTVYCEAPHDLIKIYYGWMKILDDKGFPNVWFYPRGC